MSISNSTINNNNSVIITFFLSVNVEFVVGTTKLINGNTFLTSLMEDLENVK